MRPTVFRYVLRTYAGFFAGIFAAMVTIFLVVDFVDRAKGYVGPSWVRDVAILYFYKAAQAAQQLGPAAILLAASTTVSTLRKRGELVALGALSFSPAALYVPIGIAAIGFASGLAAFDELWVTRAGQRVDDIQAHRFDRWGDWRFYNTPKQWFRHGDRIFFLRGGTVERGFDDVTVLELSPQFQLKRRTDARRMEPIEGTRWRLFDVDDRVFGGDDARFTHEAQQQRDLGIDQLLLAVHTGRPEQMRLPELRQQIRARGELGLPTRQWRLVLHNRFAYPFIGVPAALLAVGLALRPGRKGHLTAAVVEGLSIAVGLWLMLVTAKTLVLTERAPAPGAAWLPVVVMGIVAGALWLEREGLLRGRA